MNFEFLKSQFQPVQIVFKYLECFGLKIFPPILHKIQILFVIFMKEKMIPTSMYIASYLKINIF
jgi:hypothetical protein